jgi:hypothetical protein
MAGSAAASKASHSPLLLRVCKATDYLQVGKTHIAALEYVVTLSAAGEARYPTGATLRDGRPGFPEPS